MTPALRPHRGLPSHEVTVLLRLAPLATTVVLVVWICAIGFRARWWSTGRLDAGWDSTVRGLGTARLQAVARILADVGTGVPALLAVVVLVLLVLRRRGAFWAVATAAICAVSSVDVTSMKAVAKRLRPDSAFGWQNAFPSGHAAFAALLMTLTALLVLQGGWRWLTVPYPLLMAWSRTQLHAHWLSDVLAGLVLGAATAVVLVLLAEAATHLAPLRGTGLRGPVVGEGHRAPGR